MAANFESLNDEQDFGIHDIERIRFRGVWKEHRLVLGYTPLSKLPLALWRALKEHGDLAGIDFDLLQADEYQDLYACELDVLRLISEKASVPSSEQETTTSPFIHGAKQHPKVSDVF